MPTQSPPPRFALRRVGQLALTVEDLDRAVVFYQETLGMTLLFLAPGMAFFDCGGVRFLLGDRSVSVDAPSGAVVYFEVDDIDAAVAELEARSVSFEGVPECVGRLPDREIWLARFTDGEGHRHHLLCDKRLPGTAFA